MFGAIRVRRCTVSHHHTGLLWALETICWSPDCSRSPETGTSKRVDRAAGYRTAHSAAWTVWRWVRHTAAHSTEVGAVSSQSPATDVGWRLTWPVPSQHAVLSPPSAPRFHWKPESRTVLITDGSIHRTPSRRDRAGRYDASAGRVSEHMGHASAERARAGRADSFADPNSFTPAAPASGEALIA